MGAAGSEADLAAIKATFSADERSLEQEIGTRVPCANTTPQTVLSSHHTPYCLTDNTVHTFSYKLNLDYNFLSK